jgi:hypothetical protein
MTRDAARRIAAGSRRARSCSAQATVRTAGSTGAIAPASFTLPVSAQATPNATPKCIVP